MSGLPSEAPTVPYEPFPLISAQNTSVAPASHTNFQRQNDNIKCGLSKSMAIQNNECKSIVNYGDRDQISDRIVGGMDASIAEIPWMASLTVKNKGYCGATIIDERWILTAAHCLYPNVNKNDIIVRIGSNNKLSGRPLAVKEAHINPKFITNGYLINDIALIELTTSIKYDMSYANQVCLPINATLNDSHTMLTMFSGWGQISTDGKQPTNTLMKTGDSGSPLVVYQGCNAVLMGVYSYGQSHSTGHICGPKLMIFVRVAKHMPWIQQLIDNKQQSSGSEGTTNSQNSDNTEKNETPVATPAIDRQLILLTHPSKSCPPRDSRRDGLEEVDACPAAVASSVVSVVPKPANRSRNSYSRFSVIPGNRLRLRSCRCSKNIRSNPDKVPDNITGYTNSNPNGTVHLNHHNNNHNNNINTINNNNNNANYRSNYLAVNDGQVPPSPHLSINRMAYSLPNFNARFRRSSQIPGARPKSMTSEKVLEKVRPECRSPWEVIKGLFPAIGWLGKYKKEDLIPDLVSGATIAVFQVPESMGYSLLANVKPALFS
ncbi:unnamed protein product, partial [Medioppia subpectinata]